jgi:hypothetical protein
MTQAQFEFDPTVANALERYAPTGEGDGDGDWDAIVERANGRYPKRRRLIAAITLVGAAIVLGMATPLGGALADAVGDFSRWLSGTPGDPVSDDEQRAFDDANARSWIAFPGSPKLRRLIRTEFDGLTYDLVGFRSAGSLCIRVTVAGEVHDKRLTCAPVDELRHDDVPVRVLLADWGVGKGDKEETIGFDTYTSSRAQVTAGIAADGVRTLELVDDQGTHRVEAASNAFLYVADRPDVGQRVTHIRAHLQDGRAIGVPFTMPPSGAGGGFGGAAGEPGGPTKVERVVRTGRIGWVDRREERGDPIDDRVKVHLFRHIDFGRILTPDPGNPKRVAITIGPGGIDPNRAARPTLCETLLGSDGTAAGGCLVPTFSHGPFSFGYSVTGAGDQYATFAGVASDDVARLELYTATGNRIDVPLRDNTFLADVALARLPAKMVGYDSEGRVIGIQETPRDERPARVLPKSILDLTATVPGVGTLELRANATREGGECWSAKGTGDVSVRAGGCTPRDWKIAPVRVSPIPDPAVFIFGRVRGDIRRLGLKYADGRTDQISVREDGYVLEVIPEKQRTQGHELVEIVGRTIDGRVVDREHFGRG